MIAKLIKHEYRATARTFYPLFGAVLILSGLSWVLRWVSLWLHAGEFLLDMLRVILTVFTLLSVFALMVCALLVTIQRFYKNVLGDEGYLTLTLPATPSQHITAKLIVGTAWTVTALAVALFALFLLGTDMMQLSVSEGGTIVHVTWAEVVAAFQAEFGIELWRMLGLAALLFVCGVVNTYLMAYFCMTVGGQWPQQRLAASIGVFVALDFARRILLVILLVAFGAIFIRPDSGVYQAFMALTPGAVILTTIAAACTILVLEAVAYFFAARYFLTRRLNLA